MIDIDMFLSEPQRKTFIYICKKSPITKESYSSDNFIELIVLLSITLNIILN